MTFSELAKNRISVRGYKQKAVEDDKLQLVLEAGKDAPSAANRQPWYFIVVRDESKKEALSHAYAKEWFWKAPVIIIVCTEPAKAWTRADGKSYADVDGAIAVDHMTLCAADIGLGTCWIGAFDPVIVKETLKLPEGIEPLAMTPLGYPDDEGRPKTRKALSEIVRYEEWT